MNPLHENWTLIRDDSEFCVRQLQGLLALLRAQYWTYQNLHWEVQGDGFYGNHHLFEDLYGEVALEVDNLAERMVGAHGNDSVNAATLFAMAGRWVEGWARVECLFRRALLSEKCARQAIRRAYERLKDLKMISLGMDDLLMSFDGSHEKHEYLLRQVLRTKGTIEI